MPLKLKPPRPGKTPYFYIRGTHLGQRINRSAQTSDRKLALRILRQLERDIEDGKLATAETSFSAAALSYMRAGGERRYLAALIAHFNRTPTAAIGQMQVDEAAARLYPGRGSATLNRQVYTPVCAVINHVQPDRRITLKRPKAPPGRTVFLEPEQAKALLAAMSPKLKRLAMFLLYTGCRAGEACGLTWERVNLKDGIAYIPRTKGGEPRTVHLPDFIVKDWEGIKPKAGKVFGYSSRYRVTEPWKEAAVKAELPWATMHIMRHTWATWMRRYGGADVVDLIATGAWRDLASVRRYSHVSVAEAAKRADKLPSVD